MVRERLFPSGIRSMAWTRTIRYIGWGFGESLIPVLIMSLVGSFASAGLVRASYDVTLLLVLPILGVLAERVPAKWLVVAGLLVYPFVGLSYFLAGATGFVLFIVIARSINGVAWSLDSTGIDTYFRRMTPGASIASSFGFLDTLSEFGWILAALAGIWLVQFFSASQLLLLVAPGALLALPFALAARRDHPVLGHAKKKLALRHAYREALEEWRGWGGDLRLLALLLLFTECVAVLIEFFVPIDIYLQSKSLALVVLFTVVTAIPSVFGYLLGRFADQRDKTRLAGLACLAMALILIALALPIPYALIVLAGLILGVLIELLSILQKSIATRISPADHWGRLDSVFSVISGISDLAAPPLLGAALDLMGFPTLAAILAAVALLLALIFVSRATPLGAKIQIPPPAHAV